MQTPPWLAAVLLLVLFPVAKAPVRRPSYQQYTLDFEGVTSNCDFSLGVPLSNEFAVKAINFAGPGFGALNGGVPMHGCTLWNGDFPPLGNQSFDGLANMKLRRADTAEQESSIVWPSA